MTEQEEVWNIWFIKEEAMFTTEDYIIILTTE